MSNTTTTPNMFLVIPTPGSEPGPNYANDNNQDFVIVDAHNHSPGSGVQITPSGLNINANLNFQNNSPYNVFSVMFSAPATSSNLTTLYTNTQTGGGIVDLFFNDGAGNVIAITKAGEVHATIAAIPGESYSGGTFTWKQGNGSTTPANFDIGSITIRPNTAGTTNGVVLNPPSGISSEYDLQLPTVPGSTLFMTLDSSGNMGTVSSVSATQIAAGSITQSQLAVKTTGTTVGIGGVAISASCGTFTTTSASYVNITNLSVTITTAGGPVLLMLQNDGNSSGNPAQLGADTTTTHTQNQLVGCNFQILNGSTTVLSHQPYWQGEPSSGVLITYLVPASLNGIDSSVVGTPGTYTYTAQLAVLANSPNVATAIIEYASLVAYEL